MLYIFFILLFVIILLVSSRKVIKTKKYNKYESHGPDIVQKFINNKPKKEPYKPAFDFTEENNKSVEHIDTKLYQSSKTQKNKLRYIKSNIVDFIYYKFVTIFYILVIPTIITLWFAPVPISGKILATIYMAVMYPINLLSNPIICIYLILSGFDGIFGIIASIVATIVLLLNILTFLLSYIISDKKEGKKSNKLLVSLSLIMICILIGFSVFKISEKYTTINTISANQKNIELVSLTDYVSPGGTASIKIDSKPNTEHEIIVTYSSGTSTAEGLYNKFSNNYGYVEWSWKVGTNTHKGSYPIYIYNLETLESETFYFTVQ